MVWKSKNTKNHDGVFIYFVDDRAYSLVTGWFFCSHPVDENKLEVLSDEDRQSTQYKSLARELRGMGYNIEEEDDTADKGASV